jgi:hypothetical protein
MSKLIYTIVIVLVFVFTAMVFILYDISYRSVMTR